MESPRPALGVPVDLVLRGGGAKGVAYAGAVDVVQRAFGVRTYAGTSAGAIAAVMYAAGADTNAVVEATSSPIRVVRHGSSVPHVLTVGDVDRLFTSAAMFDNAGVIRWLNTFLFETMRIKPLRERPPTFDDLAKCATGDLIVFTAHGGTGLRAFGFVTPAGSKERVLLEGSKGIPVGAAVAASMAIPLVFPGVADIGGTFYDGGLLANLPAVEVAKILGDHGVTPNLLAMTLLEDAPGAVPDRASVSSVIGTVLETITNGRSATEVSRLFSADRLVEIDARPFGTLDLALTADEATLLVEAGRVAALAHALRVKAPESQRSGPMFDGDKTRTWEEAHAELGGLEGRVDSTRRSIAKTRTSQSWLGIFIRYGMRRLAWAIASAVLVLVGAGATIGAVAHGALGDSSPTRPPQEVPDDCARALLQLQTTLRLGTAAPAAIESVARRATTTCLDTHAAD